MRKRVQVWWCDSRKEAQTHRRTRAIEKALARPNNRGCPVCKQDTLECGWASLKLPAKALL